MIDDDERYGRAGDQPPPQMTRGEWRDYWTRALNDPDRIWPEDVLTEAEWNRGWFDRQVIQGRMRPEDRAGVDQEFGGDLDSSTLTDEERRERNRRAFQAGADAHRRAVAKSIAAEGPNGRCFCPGCVADGEARGGL